jgi:hypothetical protein
VPSISSSIDRQSRGETIQKEEEVH